MVRRSVWLFTFLAVIACRPVIASADNLIMFVTSESGSGDLSTWVGSNGLDGLAGADNVCQFLAGQASLPNAFTYVAYMSDSVSDAYCRVHGTSGTKAGKCGLPTLPTSAGPWSRPDGLPFGGTIAEILDQGKVLAPALIDETQTQVPGGILVLTGSQEDGTWASSAYDCNNWSSDSADVEVGRTGSGGHDWSSEGLSSCQSGARLLCFQGSAGDPLPPYSSWGRVAFVTEATGTGDLSTWTGSGGGDGLAGADAICQHAAQTAGIADSQSFKSWLSVSGTSASSRFQNDGPWMRRDGIRIVDGLAQLTANTLQASVDVTESRHYVGAPGTTSPFAWTATLGAGIPSPSTCADWTSASALDTAEAGFPSSAIFAWTQVTDLACNIASHLYCFSDLPLIFGDGFEGGDGSNWSAHQP